MIQHADKFSSRWCLLGLCVFQVGVWAARGGMSGFSFVSIEGGKEMPKLCLGLFLSAFFFRH